MIVFECAIAAINAIPDAPMGDVGELVERLLNQHHLTQGDGLLALLGTAQQAATALVAMQAEIAEMRGKLINLSCDGY